MKAEEWLVSWRRVGWHGDNRGEMACESKHRARMKVHSLRKTQRSNLSPIEHISVWKRTVTPWEQVEVD